MRQRAACALVGVRRADADEPCTSMTPQLMVAEAEVIREGVRAARPEAGTTGVEI